MQNQQTVHLNRYAIITIFLLLTLLAAGDLLEISPSFAPIVASPLFPYFHESHDLLALIIALYAAHKFSPRTGWSALAWFSALHVPYAFIVLPKELPELTRFIILTVVAGVGIHILAIRSRLETKLHKLAADLEIERTDAINRAHELTILNGIATIGVEATSVDTLIENAVLILDSALHPDYFDVGLVDETVGMLQVFRSCRTTNGERLMFPLEHGVTGQVFSTGRSRRISDVRQEPNYVAVNPEARSELCVPLKVGERVIGLINIESKQLDAFSEADEDLFKTFADQLVTAIEKVRLFQLEQRYAKEAETLRQAGAIVAATLQQDEAIERILEQLKRVVPYDTASVQLLRDGYLEIVGGSGWSDLNDVVGMRFPIPGDNPNTAVIQERKPYLLRDAPASYATFREGSHSHIRSFLGVPLIVGDQIIGMLAVDHRELNFFTTDHARIATAFADQVALAIENARLFSEVQQLARTDSLTGVFNRRHFTERAEHEVGRAIRYRHPLAAMMLDIDHFKLVNDSYGHAAGDQVIRTVAARCRNTIREIDLIGRYGGDEFVVLLLETDLEGACKVAERLRRYVIEPSIETPSAMLTITISLGLAELDEECHDLDQLLQRADQALYIAKQEGRNRTSIM